MKRLLLFLLAATLSLSVIGCPSPPVSTDDGGTDASTTPPPARREVTPDSKPSEVIPEEKPEPPANRPDAVVKMIPPKSFRNHWDSTKAKPAKKVDMNPFVARKIRRLTLLQIRNSIPRLFPGFTWKYGTSNIFDRYAITLGRADYLQLMGDNNSVTKLFMKFMDDMAGNVCMQVIPADYKKAVTQRAFVRYPDDINKNLRFLRLKFHNVLVPDNSTKEIAKLRVLFDKVKNYAKSQEKGWEMVCVAVLTSPEFYVY